MLLMLALSAVGCTEWQDFGYNRRQQMRQCLFILIGSAAAAWLFSVLQI